jgi:hypothetical protein
LFVQDNDFGSRKHERFQFGRLLANRKAKIREQLGSGIALQGCITFVGDEANHFLGVFDALFGFKGANFEHVFGEPVEQFLVPTGLLEELRRYVADVGLLAIDRLALYEGKTGILQGDGRRYTTSEVINV